ncbi:hypothetical protein CPB83DRAFT_931053 [Crepidotus variabilis]|uniref:CCHC-type domain-containing protein n=1 Tax=Crepidotus variabilis TaxID=179855 RepID=A0A9P6ESH9_9AGAR|nr:hypothetical protein CPB83DRAFT_931053 [Crepidotus variabilis]
MSLDEVIDLTLPSPTPSKLTSHEKEISTSENPAISEPRKNERKRRRQNSALATAPATASKSRDTSTERGKDGDRKPKRKKKQIIKNGESEQVVDFTKDEESPTVAEPQSDNLFYVDVDPLPIPTSRFDIHSSKKEGDIPSDQLLVPAHVTIFGSTPFQIIAPPTPSDSEEEDFIKYLDYDDATDVVRYFHDAPNEAAQIERTICKNCGVEGQHKTRDCPVMICLTCGARNEHSTRSCPISKTCFNCGMKGHINADCPNRGSVKTSRYEYKCERCSSSTHKTNANISNTFGIQECPTWWRLYEYSLIEDQARILGLRREKRNLELGEGGEGFVADDEWCYNCGESGHLGDDCETLTSVNQSEEQSAFGKANIMNGPFYDPNAPKASSSRSLVRDWGKVDKLTNINIDGVGKKARLKAKAAMQKRQSRQEDDDLDDWFGNSARPKSSNNQAPPSEPAAHSKKLSFGKSIGFQFKPISLPDRPPNPPSLLDRISDSPPESRSSRRSDRRERPRHRDRDRYDHSPQSYRDKDRDRHRRRDDARPSKQSEMPAARPDIGPRYRGGYGR